jgi:hypothetical protein
LPCLLHVLYTSLCKPRLFPPLTQNIPLRPNTVSCKV